MQLIGMLDSPYVRRVAISLHLLNIPFIHRPISVFSDFERFRGLNPVVKVPTLVCDDGSMLMDSSLILQFVEFGAARSLIPADPRHRQSTLRITGLALAACEKTVQLVYERKLRPPEKQHGPWIERVTGQLDAAYRVLEQELASAPLGAEPSNITQAGVTTAVAWAFTRMMIPEAADAATHPALAEFSAAAEDLAAFQAAPP
jgi:glutathione S-transferase